MMNPVEIQFRNPLRRNIVIFLSYIKKKHMHGNRATTKISTIQQNESFSPIHKRPYKNSVVNLEQIQTRPKHPPHTFEMKKSCPPSKTN